MLGSFLLLEGLPRLKFLVGFLAQAALKAMSQ